MTVIEGSIDGDGGRFCWIGYVKFEIDSNRKENLFHIYNKIKLPCRIDSFVVGGNIGKGDRECLGDDGGAIAPWIGCRRCWDVEWKGSFNERRGTCDGFAGQRWWWWSSPRFRLDETRHVHWVSWSVRVCFIVDGSWNSKRGLPSKTNQEEEWFTFF